MANELEIIEKLDEDFKIRLSEIQPYFSALKSPHEVRLCREWLHKLCKTNRHDEVSLRNVYLAKLMEQLKNGELSEPFNELPNYNKSLTPIYPLAIFNVHDNEMENEQQHTLVTNTLNCLEICKINKTAADEEKCAENKQVSDKKIQETEDDNKSDPVAIDTLDTAKEFQIKHSLPQINFNLDKLNVQGVPINNLLSVLTMWQQTAPGSSEGGDGITLYNETKKKLESIEKIFEEFKIKNEFLADQIKLYADTNKLSNDHMSMINVELNKVKNSVDLLCSREATKETDVLNNFKFLTDKITEINTRLNNFTSEATNLKTTVEDACEKKEVMKDMLQLMEYMKEQFLQISENQSRFTEQIRKYEDEIDQLKAYADIKTREVDVLEERAENQKMCLETFENSIKKIEEYIIEKLTILIQYTTELETVNNKLEIANKTQRNVMLQIAEKLKEMDKPTETKEMQDMIASLNNEYKQYVENVEKCHENDTATANPNESVN